MSTNMRDQYVDALVVGAGLGGIYQVYALRNMGLSVRVVEAASDVGGTWYFNRYPGAMSDTESYLYRYSWDKEDLQTYPWTHHYLFQPDVLAYLRHVVDKHDLRKYMDFNTEMVSADYDESANIWRIGLKTGEDDEKQVTARYLITALGLLSKPHFPNIPGIDSFTNGKVVHSQQWSPDIKVQGKRVGVIGCGSTGVQIITALAPQVQSLTCFQRRPQYSVPSGNGPVDPAYRAWVNAHYDDIFEQCGNSITAFGIDESTRSYHDVPDPAERERIFEDLWERGNGFRFMFGGFCDITTDPDANEGACEFIRGKIAQIVKDPEKARKLQPHDRYARRPLCDNGYYEQFNRPNVDIVDVKETAIVAITPKGVKTSDGKVHELDLIVLATGFDAIDGSYARIRIRGRDGRTLKDHWAARGAVSYLGVCAARFPNLFMIGGPQGPFCNFPPAVENSVDFITAAIARAEEARRSVVEGKKQQEEEKAVVVEALPEAEREWVELCDRLCAASLFKTTHSWIFGMNIQGKEVACRFYFAGLSSYRKTVKEVIDGGWRGFRPFA